MTVLLVVNTPPYGSEGPYNAFRLAEALALREERVEVFLMGDGVHAARAGQEPRDAHASLEHDARRTVGARCDRRLLWTCCRARGVTEDDLVDGVATATIHDLAEAVARCERTLLVLTLERRVRDFVARRGVLHRRRARPAHALRGRGLDGHAGPRPRRRPATASGARLRRAARRLRPARGRLDARPRDRRAGVRRRPAIALDVVCLEAGLRGPDFQARAREVRYARAWAVGGAQGLRRGRDGAQPRRPGRDDPLQARQVRLAAGAAPGCGRARRARRRAPRSARPLLCLGADEVREYCRARAIEFGEDVTNAGPCTRATSSVTRSCRGSRAQPAGRRDARGERRGRRPRSARSLDAPPWTAPGRGWAPTRRATRRRSSTWRLSRSSRRRCARSACDAWWSGPRGGGARRAARGRSLARLAVRRDDAGTVTLRGGWEVVRGGGRLRLRRRTPRPRLRAGRSSARSGSRTPFCGARITRPSWSRVRCWPPPAASSARATRRAPRASRRSRPRRARASSPARGDRFTPVRDGARDDGGALSRRRPRPRGGARRALVLEPRRACRLGGLRGRRRQTAREGCAALPRGREYVLHAPRRRGGRVSDPIARSW